MEEREQQQAPLENPDHLINPGETYVDPVDLRDSPEHKSIIQKWRASLMGTKGIRNRPARRPSIKRR